MSAMLKRQKSSLLIKTILFSLLIVIFVIAQGQPLAYALETPEYTPGKDYRIDEPEAFRDQNIDHEDDQSSSGSTQYYLSCPFYLEWTSADMTVYEGEDAYIGCSAVGLLDLKYEWYLSRDGGKTYEETGLLGSEHTLPAMVMNSPAQEPYQYKCIITNGDQVSTLETIVNVTVLKGSADNVLSQTGDMTFWTLFLLGLFIAMCILILTVVYVKTKDRYAEK